MGLLNNMTIFHGAGRQFGGVTGSHRVAFARGNARFNRFAGDMGHGIAPCAATPVGYLQPAVLSMPRTSGGIASHKQISANISETSANLVRGAGLEASLSGAIALTDAELGLIVSMLASLSASIGVTDAILSSTANLVAEITATMSVTDAQLGAIVDILASLSASISTTDAGIFATSEMYADLSVQNEFSSTNLANAVWNAAASDYNEVGTMGEKVNDAGSASNPWTEVIEGSYTATEVLRLLLAVAAGKTTIVDNGGGTATVTFRDTGDSKNRIVASMTGSERTTVTKDPS